MDEQWKDIEGYEGLYQISNKGRVKSLARIKFKEDGTIHGRVPSDFILKLAKNKKGYLRARIYKDSIPNSYMVHRLVASAFLEVDTVEREFVNHKNGIKDDNSASNLEWVTPRENQNHYLMNIKLINTPIGIKKKGKKYISRIWKGRKEIYLGYFATIEEAVKARLDYETNNFLPNKYL